MSNTKKQKNMPTANLNRGSVTLDEGKDAIVIIKATGHLPGGCTLDVTGFTEDAIRTGHVLVIHDTTKVISPMPVASKAYGSKPEGTSYFGVLGHSVLKSDPRASVVTMGQVNAAASPYPVTEEIKTGLPHIQFLF